MKKNLSYYHAVLKSQYHKKSIHITSSNSSSSSISGEIVSEWKGKRKRDGKGSNILLLVRKLLKCPENWKSIGCKRDYQFLGTLHIPSPQQLYFIPNCFELEQGSCTNPHYLWTDIQLSKGHLNKDQIIEVELVDINGQIKKEKMFYRSAPCLEVKHCPQQGCKYIAPIRERRHCPNHPEHKLARSENCPVEFVYMFPQKYQEDHRRWIGGIVRVEKHTSSNLHNHPLHGSTKISQCVQDKVASAVISNPALTPTDIASGKGLGFTPSAVDAASSHLGKLVCQVKRSSAVSAERWSPTTFEKCADELDENDFEKSNDTTKRKQKYLRLGRPLYLQVWIMVFSFAMTPFMADVAARADFIQTDITYDHMQGSSIYFMQ